MNVTGYNQQLIRGASENNVNATGLKSVKNRTKQQRANSGGTTTPSRRKTDKVQISKTGASLATASTTGIQQKTAHSEKSDLISQTAIQHVVDSEMATEEQGKDHKATRQKQSIFKNSVENHSNPGANTGETGKMANSATNFSEYLMPSQNHGIDSVMSKYKEAQDFMAQMDSQSINSTA
jgi:hypothetical protein